MASTLQQGMDPARVREVATALADLGRRTHAVRDDGTTVAGQLSQVWLGADLEAFSRDWNTRAQQVTDAATGLERIADLLHRQADAQEETSSSGGVGASGAGATGGGVRATAAPMRALGLLGVGAGVGAFEATPILAAAAQASGGAKDQDKANGPMGQTIPEDAIRVTSGTKGNWTEELLHPKPNSTYWVNDRYLYVTDDKGRVENAYGTLDAIRDGVRNESAQRRAGFEDRQVGDQGGHIFGRQFGGPGEDLNMLAMAAAVNGGKQFGALETTWADLIKEGHVVEMHLEPTYPGDSKRPESFVVEWTKDGEAQPPVKFRNIGTGELKNK